MKVTDELHKKNVISSSQYEETKYFCFCLSERVSEHQKTISVHKIKYLTMQEKSTQHGLDKSGMTTYTYHVCGNIT